MPSWEEIAAAKRESILESIPRKWHIPQIPSREEQKDVTGPYIHKFLDKAEIAITETDVIGIANNISSGNWTATEVTKAFCHRASLAHQFVRILIIIGPGRIVTHCNRRIACMRHSSTQRYRMPSTWTTI
jgi:amidase